MRFRCRGGGVVGRHRGGYAGVPHAVDVARADGWHRAEEEEATAEEARASIAVDAID